MPQYFKQELFFRKKKNFIFYIPEQKRTHLGSVITQTTFTTPRILSFCPSYAGKTIINCHLQIAWQCSGYS